jgi:hypothetical protein
MPILPMAKGVAQRAPSNFGESSLYFKKIMEANENSLDMLERLLHNEIKPHSTLGLPSEPQVMRTKRMGHRKAQSISSFLPGSQSALLPSESNHKRNSSLSGVSDSSDFKFSSKIQQPYSLPSHPLSGHRRFHSVGNAEFQNANLTYQFPSSPSTPHEPSSQQSFGDNPMAYTFPAVTSSHQKSLSGTSDMFNEFVVMNLEKENSLGSQHPMARLHPLQDLYYPSSQPGYVPDEHYSEYNGYQTEYIPASAREGMEMHFNDESGNIEEGDEIV